MNLADILPALPWLLPYGSLAVLARKEPDIGDATAARGALLSVVIPARNEARNIATVLRSVLDTSYAPLEVIVVDDRSTDQTAAVVEEMARSDARVRLIRGAELPPGWYGKPWACWQGYRRARGDLILFTDADTRHEPELHARAAGALHAEGAALVTVAPHQRCVTFWERVVMPQIWLLLGLRYHPARVNRAAHRRDVIANGQFVLMTRAAYEAVGTHEAVRGEVAEDLALAQACFDSGRKVHFAFAERLMETRMYENLPQLVEGWSKNVYLGSRRSFPDEPILQAAAPVMLAAAMLFWLLPGLFLVLAVAGITPALLAPAALAYALATGFWALMCFGMRIPLAYAPLYPLGAAVALYIFMRSTWRGARRVEWRGRRYEHTPRGVAGGSF